MADPLYDAVFELAKGHLLQAFEAFKADVRIPWQEMTGNVPKGSAPDLGGRAEGNADAPSADRGAAFMIVAIYLMWRAVQGAVRDALRRADG